MRQWAAGAALAAVLLMGGQLVLAETDARETPEGIGWNAWSQPDVSWAESGETPPDSAEALEFAGGSGGLPDVLAEFDEQAELDAIGGGELQDALPQDAKSLMESAGIEGIDYKKLLTLGPEEFFSEIWAMVQERLRTPLRVFGILMGIVVLCAMLDGMKTALWETSLNGVFSAVSVVCVAAAVTTPIVDCITSTARAINECATFITAFIPVFSTVVTVSGQPVTAGAYTAFLFMACQMVSQIVSGTLVPLMGIYLAFCIAGNLAPGLQVTSVAKVVRQTVNWALGLLLTLFVALLSLQTFVASGSDQVVSKAAKFLLGSFVPVVGGALGDAFVVTQGYMKLLKASVGAFGILAALMTFLPIFLQTVIWYLTVTIAGAIGEMLSARQTADILKSAGETLGVLMGVILCFALLIIVSTSLVLMATTGT